MSYGPSLSSDGRLVAFISWATDLVPGDSNHCLAVAAELPSCGDVFVHDMRTGRTSRVSISSSGRQADQRAETVVISGNGRYVAFSSWASTLVDGDTNECSEGGGADEPKGCPDIFVRDLVEHTTERVSLQPSGAQFEARSLVPSISRDGKRISFIVTDHATNESEVYVRNLATRTTQRVPYPEGVSTDQGQRQAALSGDGTQVVYTLDVGSPQGCRARFAPPGEQICTSYHEEMYAYDLRSRTTEKITPPTSGDGSDSELRELSLSSDGRIVVFSTDATNLSRRDRNGKSDVFLYDRQHRSLVLVSTSTRGSSGNDDSGEGAINFDATVVVFESFASNLISGDTNRAADVFTYDVATRRTARASVGSTA